MPACAELPSPVRQGTSWKPTVLLGFAICALTILAVQLWGQIRAQIEAAKVEPATAIIGLSPSVCNKDACTLCARQPASQTAVCSKTLGAIKDQLTSPDLLRQVWHDLGLADVASESEKLRRALKVDLQDSPIGGKCLRLILSWPNPQAAARILGILGDRYAEKYQKVSASAPSREYLDAQKAADRAGQAFQKALADLDFFENWLAWQSAVAEATTANQDEFVPLSSRSPPQNAAGPLRNASDIENPAWIGLQQDLAGLRDKEARLLETRTALHPEVKDIQDQIRESEAKLATISQWIHQAAPVRPEAVEPEVMTEPPFASNQLRIQNSDVTNRSAVANSQTEAEDAELLARLEDQVQSTAHTYCIALDRERAALSPRTVSPEIGVRVFAPRKLTAAKPSQPRFVWLAGLAMALSACLISAGTTIEPPIATADELHRVASAPIVGVVPSYNPAADPRAIRRRKRFLRSWLFLGGLTLMGLCVWAIVWLV